VDYKFDYFADGAAWIDIPPIPGPPITRRNLIGFLESFRGRKAELEHIGRLLWVSIGAGGADYLHRSLGVDLARWSLHHAGHPPSLLDALCKTRFGLTPGHQVDFII
jgi:hypothetical protein